MSYHGFASKKTYQAWFLLKITYALLLIVAGFDKFFNAVTNWEKYVNPIILKILHLDLMTLILIVGVIEILLGLLVLKWTRYGAYAIAGWLLIIAINLVSMFAYYDIAVRDIVMAIGAISLAKLTETKIEAEVK